MTTPRARGGQYPCLDRYARPPFGFIFQCTAAVGHRGEHIAHGSGTGVGDELTWPNEADIDDFGVRKPERGRQIRTRILAIVLAVLVIVTTATVLVSAGRSTPNLPYCATEDSDNCLWDADVQGNGTGRSFIAWQGHTYFLDTTPHVPWHGDTKAERTFR